MLSCLYQASVFGRLPSVKTPSMTPLPLLGDGTDEGTLLEAGYGDLDIGLGGETVCLVGFAK